MSEAEAHTAGVKILAVKKTDFVQTIQVGGKINFAQTDEYRVIAHTSGTIHFNRTFTDGTPVKKGEALCVVSADKIDGGDPIKKTEVTYKIAKEELERKKQLLKESLITQEEYNAALEHFENSRIAYEATVEEKDKSGHTIKSPLNGYVMEALVSNGDYVSTGTPIFHLVRNNKMMLSADLPLRYQKYLSKVSAATFATEGESQVYHTDSLKGKLLPNATGVSASGAYITLRWEMERRPNLWAGSFAKVYLHTTPIVQTLVLPVSAISEEYGTYFVYVKVDKTHYSKRRVEIGASDGQRVQITSGLHEGENVVSEGVMSVRQAGMSKAIGGHGHSH